jgi:hypothetical protein
MLMLTWTPRWWFVHSACLGAQPTLALMLTQKPTPTILPAPTLALALMLMLPWTAGGSLGCWRSSLGRSGREPPRPRTLPRTRTRTRPRQSPRSRPRSRSHARTRARAHARDRWFTRLAFEPRSLRPGAPLLMRRWLAQTAHSHLALPAPCYKQFFGAAVLAVKTSAWSVGLTSRWYSLRCGPKDQVSAL